MAKESNESPNSNSFESLRQEIEREMQLEPGNRSSEHFSKTLAIFEAAEVDELGHDLWRQSKMLPAMLEILRYSFFDMNPLLKDAAYIATLQPGDPQVAEWQQEVDDDGYSQEELAARHTPVYPSFTREALELYAARKYIKWRSLKAKEPVAEPTLKPEEIEQESTNRNKSDARKILSVDDVVKIRKERDPNYSIEDIRATLLRQCRNHRKKQAKGFLELPCRLYNNRSNLSDIELHSIPDKGSHFTFRQVVDE